MGNLGASAVFGGFRVSIRVYCPHERITSGRTWVIDRMSGPQAAANGLSTA